jgi:hypothetical protein
VSDTDSDTDTCRVFVCQGPPACALQDDEAVAAQIEGCPWCRVTTFHADGTITTSEPSRQ